MKKIITMVAAVAMMFTAAGAYAQDKAPEQKRDGNPGEKIKLEKIAYLTDAIQLTTEEAEAFWPIYNKAEAEKTECMKASMTACKALKEAVKNGKSESEIAKLLDEYNTAKQAGTDIDEKYTKEYRKILSETKIAKLYLAEEGFRRHQFNRLNQGPQGPRPEGRKPEDNKGNDTKSKDTNN